MNERPEQQFTIQAASLHSLRIGERDVPIDYVRNRRARRYILRIVQPGRVRATIPPFGSKSEAYAFAQRARGWIERQLNKPGAAPPSRSLSEGGSFLFRGELTQVRIDPVSGMICFADQRVNLSANAPVDLWPSLRSHLFQLAIRELAARTMELAWCHDSRVRRVVIRSQRTRWGSCSPLGTVSLNWRLIQMPPFVSDYIILHELAHLREMNHSKAFWRCVESICPEYRTAERWIKAHSGELRRCR
jgi:predicted metal-dependent hydrolase